MCVYCVAVMCVLWCLLEYLSFTRRHHKACRVIIRKALQEVVSSQQCMAHFLRPGRRAHARPPALSPPLYLLLLPPRPFSTPILPRRPPMRSRLRHRLRMHTAPYLRAAPGRTFSGFESRHIGCKSSRAAASSPVDTLAGRRRLRVCARHTRRRRRAASHSCASLAAERLCTHRL